MAVYYRGVRWLRLKWSKTVYPKLLQARDFWLCLLAHAAMVVALRRGYLEFPEDGLPSMETLWLLVLMALLALGAAALERWRRHEGMVRACASVGEETQLFVQELSATFGRVDDALLLRFVAAKYAMAAIHVFFAALTSGSVPARAWSEMRAHGYLEDRELQFLSGQYGGDRMALLHVWAMWAVNEAATVPGVRQRLGPEALSGGLARLSAQLRSVKAAACEATGYVSAPWPYHFQQLVETTLLLAMLLSACVTAPASSGETYYAASVGYAALLVVAFGLREAGMALAEPLRCEAYGFPVVAFMNTTNDAIVQLLAASTPAAFSPCDAWWDSNRALFSQGQVERRLHRQSFDAKGSNPCSWTAVEAPVKGDMMSPPLVDIGCCHVHVGGAAVKRSHGEKVCAYEATGQRQRQHGVGALLAKVEAGLESKGMLTSSSTAIPSEDTTSEHSLPPERSLAASFRGGWSPQPSPNSCHPPRPGGSSVAPVPPPLPPPGFGGDDEALDASLYIVGATAPPAAMPAPRPRTEAAAAASPGRGRSSAKSSPESGGSRSRGQASAGGTFLEVACNLFPTPAEAGRGDPTIGSVDVDAAVVTCHPCQT